MTVVQCELELWLQESSSPHDEELLLYIEPDEVTDLLGEDELGGG